MLDGMTTRSVGKLGKKRYGRYTAFFKKRSTLFPEEEIKEAILALKVMPSMRCLMTAGPALDRDNIAGYNCFPGDTHVTTREFGITTFNDIKNQSVHVVDGNGEWVETTCQSFGTQQIVEVHLKTSGKGSFKIRSTPNHRWILRDGTEKVTLDLKSGDRLASVSMPERSVFEMNDDYIKGVQHGIVFGDGNAVYKRLYNQHGSREKDVVIERTCSSFHVRLCGKKTELARYFKNYSISYPKSYEGDSLIHISDRAIDLKSLPEFEGVTDEYLTGFIRGWFATDGSYSKESQATLMGKKDHIEWLLKVGPRLGFVPHHWSFDSELRETNYGRANHLSGTVEFDRRWMVKEDFLCDKYKERFVPIDTKRHPGFGMVDKIVETSSYEEVFCFDVPTTHSFLLTKNLLTGNCSYVAIDHPRAFDEILYILMCGTGVGFSVERQFINSLPLINEDMYNAETVIQVHDSRIGWATAFRQLIALLYAGQIPRWDLTKLRPKGARLKTFGGRASGPEPLNHLFQFCVDVFRRAAGRKLNSLECHDIVCKIADIVIVGGVRRCLKFDTQVQMKDGSWRQINQVVVGDSVRLPDGSSALVSNLFDNGQDEIVKIHLQDGTSFECSKNHRWFVYNHKTDGFEWVETSALSEGEYSMVDPTESE